MIWLISLFIATSYYFMDTDEFLILTIGSIIVYAILNSRIELHIMALCHRLEKKRKRT